ncbi:MAG TPA: diglucosylglycerate octanoyltransferase [Actinomycetales bacterium]|nr:diglucosylglycerate octanoyltransferase [Actinomycetales bacterium]
MTTVIDGRLLVLGDSLTYHGPAGPELTTERRLWPNLVAERLGTRTDLVARQGWTARDVWWAVTKDPVVWSVLLPRAGALVIAVGGMDALPASIPTYLREGIAYVRPGPLRRRVRRTYRRAHPRVAALWGGRLRVLPQSATDHYLSRVVNGVRHYRPDLPVVALTPPPWRSADYPPHRTHRPSLVAARSWADREGVRLADVEAVVRAMHDRDAGNADGLHWDWSTHAAVADVVTQALTPPSF